MSKAGLPQKTELIFFMSHINVTSLFDAISCILLTCSPVALERVYGSFDNVPPEPSKSYRLDIVSSVPRTSPLPPSKMSDVVQTFEIETGMELTQINKVMLVLDGGWW